MRWEWIFTALSRVCIQHELPEEPFHALLDAFEQDVRFTASSQLYATRSDLMAYCSRSANPVGRLMLHLLGSRDERSLRQSDHVCSALQLINFWQDLDIDFRRGRFYVPRADATEFGLDPRTLGTGTWDDNRRALVRVLCEWAYDEMLQGSSLAYRLPGRSGLELRLVVQGGLRILEKMAHVDYNAFQQRPRLQWIDGPLLALRCLYPPQRRAVRADSR